MYVYLELPDFFLELTLLLALVHQLKGSKKKTNNKSKATKANKTPSCRVSRHWNCQTKCAQNQQTFDIVHNQTEKCFTQTLQKKKIVVYKPTKQTILETPNF